MNRSPHALSFASKSSAERPAGDGGAGEGGGFGGAGGVGWGCGSGGVVLGAGGVGFVTLRYPNHDEGSIPTTAGDVGG